MAPQAAHRPPRAIGYLRVSTAEQADSGAGLAAQRAAVQSEAERRGWDLELVEDAGVSAKDLQRPALTAALARLDAHDADILIVAKLDRLSRSVHDFTGIVAHADRHRWSVVCLDVGVDTSTAAGNLVSNVMASVAEWERRVIGERTRAALAARRAEGVTLGRPRALPDDVVRRIVAGHGRGESLRTIAAALQADGVATARGGTTWHASTVRAVLGSQAATGLR